MYFKRLLRLPAQFGSLPIVPRHPSIGSVKRYTNKVHGFLTLYFSFSALPENLELLKSHRAHSVLVSFVARKSNQEELDDKMLSGMYPFR